MAVVGQELDVGENGVSNGLSYWSLYENVVEDGFW